MTAAILGMILIGYVGLTIWQFSLCYHITYNLDYCIADFLIHPYPH